MDNPLWETASVQALGKISDTGVSTDWENLLPRYMKTPVKNRSSLLQHFATLAIRISPDNIHFIWLPRVQLIEENEYLVGFDSDSMAQRNLVAVKLEKLLYDFPAVITRQSKLFPMGEWTIKEYWEARGSCDQSALEDPAHEFNGEPPDGHHMTNKEQRRFQILPRSFPIPF